MDTPLPTGVVGIVPFGALGVHPNAPFRNEVGDFASIWPIFSTNHFVDEDVCFTQQGSITANLVLLEANSCFALVIEFNGVFRILEQFIVRLDAVRHVGINNESFAKYSSSFSG